MKKLLWKKEGFIDRTPVRFIGGLFILLVGLLAKSVPLTFLGIYDLFISFVFFTRPHVDDNKTFKLLAILLYGILLIWSMLWLTSKFAG